jgi:carboxyl-terminal processing protease
MKKLVLDLQSNPGGYMNIAIDMADDFLASW